MTFLELAQRLRQESGIAGSGPTDVTTQTGILKRVVDWINSAWFDIQSDREDWDWMWVEDASANTTAGDRDLSVTDFSVTDLARWDVETMRIYLTSDGQSSETYLDYLPYERYKEQYLSGVPSSGPPSFFTILPDGTIRLGPTTPDDDYTLTINYYKQPTKMTADGDIPEAPVWLHDCIWARAMVDYAYFDEAITIGQGSMTKAKNILMKLSGVNLPQAGIRGVALY